jgi:DNA polymerase-3 subunit delta
LEKFGDTDLEELDGESTSVEVINAAVRATPFLAEKRLVLLKNFLTSKKADAANALLPTLEQLPDTTFLLMIEAEPDKRTSIFKAVTQMATQRLFMKPQGAQLNTWVVRRAETLGSRIDLQTAAYLVSWVGNDLHALYNEIQKLSLFCEGQQVTVPMIDLLVTDNVQKSIFTLTDQLSKKDFSGALETIDSLQKQGEDASFVFAMITRQFRLLLEMKALAEEGLAPPQIARTMAVHPFVVQNTLRFSKNFTHGQLRAALTALLELDRRLKSGRIPLKSRDEDHFLLALEKILLA